MIRILTAACAAFAALPLCGAPPARSFSGEEVLMNGPAMSFAETPGCLFVGSNGLSVFDGRGWSRIALGEGYGVRALEAVGDRVYVGSIGEVGYAERGKDGAWTYVSLLPELEKAGVPDPGDIWACAAVSPGAVVFVGSRMVLRWEGGRFEAWKLGGNLRLQAFGGLEKGKVWIYEDDAGLLALGAEGNPRIVRPLSALPPHPIVWMADCGGVLAGTSEDVYRLTEDGFARLDALSKAIQGRLPNAAARIGNDRLAIGTFRGGVVLAENPGAKNPKVEILDRDHGLGDDTVETVWADGSGNAWAGLEDHCVRIEGIGVAERLGSADGLARGAPREVLRAGNETYVLTGRALYALDDSPEGARLSPVIGAEAELHAGAVQGETAWVAGFGGLWRVQGRKAVHEVRVTGDVTAVAAAPEAGGWIFYTDGYALKSLEWSPYGGWASRDLGFTIPDTPESLRIDGENLWLGMAQKGLLRFKVTPATDSGSWPRLSEPVHLGSGRGWPKEGNNPRLFRIGKKLLAFSGAGILDYQELLGFTPDPRFADWIPVEGAEDPEGRSAAWVLRRRDLGNGAPEVLVRVSEDKDGGLKTEFLDAPGLDGIGGVTGVSVVRNEAGEDPEAAWIGGRDGLLRLSVGQLKAAGEAPRARLRSEGGTATGHPAGQRISFTFAAENAQPGDPAYFETQLGGVQSGWTAPKAESSVDLVGLAAGSYDLSVRAVDKFGRAGPASSRFFVVKAPWYRTWPAFAGYGAALVLGVAGFLRLRMRRLERQNERLDRLVADRTRELELSNTAKAEFLENISHEIRNPLNGIVGLAAMLKPGELPPGQREVVASLGATVGHLRKVSEEVLEFSKLEYGYVTVSERAFGAMNILEEVTEMHAEAAKSAGCELKIEPPGAQVPSEFLGDADKIRTILSNFVGNAVKYAPGKPIEIALEIEAPPETQMPCTLTFSVTDHGPGVPDEEQALIFQKFVRGADARRREVAGSGIGLATCRLLAQRMGGNVGIESEPGEGASFHLWLELRRSEAEPSAEGRLNSHVRSPVVPNGEIPGSGAPGARSALVLDDESYNRFVVGGIFREMGWAVSTAASPEEALALFRANPADIVLLDIELNGAKGDQVAREMRCVERELGRSPALMIATTASDSAETRTRCSAAGMDRFLLKPFDTAQVRAIVDGRNEASAPSFSARRTFELHAQGAGESAEAAAGRFLESVCQESEAIREGLSRGDPEMMLKGAHRLRTLASLVRFQTLNRLAGELEDRAREEDASSLGTLAGKVLEESEALRLQLADRTNPFSAQ